MAHSPEGLKPARRLFIEKVNKFRYLGAYITSRNEVEEEIKSRLVSGNACFFSV
jgi:hypothetical protein